jgi:hypothetical protein
VPGLLNAADLDGWMRDLRLPPHLGELGLVQLQRRPEHVRLQAARRALQAHAVGHRLHLRRRQRANRRPLGRTGPRRIKPHV